MKKQVFTLIAFLLVAFVFGQQRIPLAQSIKNQAHAKPFSAESGFNQNPVMYKVPPIVTFPEDLIGGTVYDLQSNGCTPFGRLTMFSDSSFGAVWTRGMNPTGYADRGTGYNYYDGVSWGTEPTARVETVRTGWPSVAPLGTGGEVIVAHAATGGLVMSQRPTKGSGPWAQSVIAPPAGVNTIWWSRMITSGPDNNTIHILVLTLPTANGGVAYQGQDGALLYYRSTDGGNTWSDAGTVLTGLGATSYNNFTADSYSWIGPMGDKLAFIVCDPWNDLILMKSEDNGANWEKTVVWEHPYPLWNGQATDTIYCPDGSAHGAFDKNGKIHLVFGVNREISDGTNQSWFPFVDGVAYWNEDMPAWVGGDQLHCLDPDLLFQSGHLVGWMQDVDNNQSIDLVANTVEAIAKYYLSPSSFPQIAIDEQGRAVIIYSSITETFNNGAQDYRHIWARASSDNGATWGAFNDLTADPVHMFDECVFPTISARSTSSEWGFIYQYDNEPGLAIRGDEDNPTDNYLNYYHLSKIINSAPGNLVAESRLTDFQPNPARTLTGVTLTLNSELPVKLSVSNLSGQVVKAYNYGMKAAGVHYLTLEIADLDKGVYLCNYTVGMNKIARKLLIQ